MKKGFLLLLMLLLFNQSYSQCLMLPVSLEKRSDLATLVVIGNVKSKNCELSGNHIVTKYIIRIENTIKGKISLTEISLICEGGTLGNRMEKVDYVSDLPVGAIAMFFLEPLKQSAENYKLVAASQGHILFEPIANTAFDVLQSYGKINDLVKIVSEINNVAFKPYPVATRSAKLSVVLPVINSITPLNVPAGWGKTIVISGKGFGNIQNGGKVIFKNADDGGSKDSIEATEYKTWFDTQIELVVPSKAQTGTVKVRIPGNSLVSSLQTLTIPYARLNVPGTLQDYEPTQVAQSSSGGYVWQMNKDFEANTEAKTAFLRSFDKWRCNSLINWSIGESSTVNTSDADGKNLIYFENLPEGVLGSCQTYYNSCGVNTWYVNEYDIRYGTGINWHYGDGPIAKNAVDFESVTLHELGHGVQLGHFGDKADLMYYALSYGQQKRAISVNDSVCANLIMSQSQTSNICGPSAMRLLSKSFCGNEKVAAVDGNDILYYPTAFKDKFSVTFKIGSTQQVKIKFINSLGEEFPVVLDKEYQAGTYHEELSPGLESGLYFLDFTSADFHVVKRIIKE